MSTFFTYKNQLPNDVAVGTFTTEHWLVLLIIAIAIMFTIKKIKRESPATRDKFIKIIAWSVLVLELIRMVWIVMIGNAEILPVALLPLHLCGLMAIFIPLAVYTKNNVLIEFVYIGGLAGAGMALLTPDVAMYPLLSLQYLQSMIIHAFIFLSGLYFIVVENYRPNIKNVFKVLGLFALLALLVTPVNIMLAHQQANYFFLMYGIEDTILHTIDQNTTHVGYLMTLASIVIAFVMIMYMPFVKMQKKTL